MNTTNNMEQFKITQHSVKLPINNVEIQGAGEVQNQPKTFRHSVLLPNSIRCIICGPSNCGKTNVMISLLESPNGLRFENVYVYARSLFQPKYKRLKELLSAIKGIEFYEFSSNEQIIPLKNVKPNSVFIFDDVIFDKQNNIREYFCMSRHKKVDCFYLSQSYAHIPKHLIRENTNLVVLFKQDDTNLKHIYNDFGIATDMKFEKFKYICTKAWSEKYGFLVVDTERALNDGRYRFQFDKFISFPAK